MNELPRNELIAAHVPVLHRGYVDFFNDHPNADIGVFATDIIETVDYLRKDIRALSPELARKAIEGLGRSARLLSVTALYSALQDQNLDIYLPDDDISRSIITDNIDGVSANVVLEPVFLRWDRRNVNTQQEVVPDRIIHETHIAPEILHALGDEQQKSRNWWRHVGVAIVKDANVIARAHNTSLPTEYTMYIDSDPRITAYRGANIETSIDIHAESSAIAYAAKNGIVLEGSEIYVSTFPCPNCAKLIASSGIKTCYFVEGYAMVDGYSTLKSADVEIIKIDTTLGEDASSRIVPYDTKKTS